MGGRGLIDSQIQDSDHCFINVIRWRSPRVCFWLSARYVPHFTTQTLQAQTRHAYQVARTRPQKARKVCYTSSIPPLIYGLQDSIENEVAKPPAKWLSSTSTLDQR